MDLNTWVHLVTSNPAASLFVTLMLLFPALRLCRCRAQQSVWICLMVLLSCSHRALSGQRADRVPAAYEGLAEERSGDAVRARRGQQPADREAEAQGENRPACWSVLYSVHNKFSILDGSHRHKCFRFHGFIMKCKFKEVSLSTFVLWVLWNAVEQFEDLTSAWGNK